MRRERIYRRLFLASALAALVGLLGVQVPDPALIGITEEPSRILFYALSALLLLLAGLTAFFSGALWWLERRRSGVSAVRAVLVLASAVCLAVVLSLLNRLLWT